MAASASAPAAQAVDPQNTKQSPHDAQPGAASTSQGDADDGSQSKGAVTDTDGEDPADSLINLTVILPDANSTKVQMMISPQEQVHEIRQSVIDLPSAFQFTCFHLEHHGQKVNDFIPVSEIADLTSDPVLHLVQDPYTEKEARIHFVRIRELIGAAGDRSDSIHGTLSGASLFEDIGVKTPPEPHGAAKGQQQVPDHDFKARSSLANLTPKAKGPAPKTVKSMMLSSWNPPPPHLRQRGHLLYLAVGTNEGEQFQLTAHVSGFFVNRSSNAKFDPFPKAAPKSHSSHSILELLGLISPSFNDSFLQLQEYSNQHDPLTTFQITNTLPAAPWAVPSPTSDLCAHVPDAARPQETYLLSGVENTDTLRDWNEEFQSAKELPKDNVQDRVFRERLISKLFADYNDAASKGAVMVSRGEIAPLNPTECRDAQIFVYNNIFFSFGADGVGTFTSEGGDEAARVATGKDVSGVRLVNQLDIDELFTPATVVVDYLGKRIVAQSIVPGIFKQREPGENQIDYGAVDGRDIIAADERFAPAFEKLSKALRVKQHSVWDKQGQRFDLEASVETKGLLGTDGRKYVLDLYRITPLDVAWLNDTTHAEAGDYPHRMTVLRPELIDLLGRFKMQQWIDKELANREQAKKSAAEGNAEEAGDQDSSKEPDLSKFQFSLNPDAFSGQTPQTDEEKKQLEEDERQVDEACQFLRDRAIPDLLRELSDSEISFPMDGHSLGRLLHKRGINMRYLGRVCELCTEDKLRCLRDLCVQDMTARAFKHVSAKYLRSLPLPVTADCLSHLLNCLLGYEYNANPVPAVDTSLRSVYADADWSFETVTPESLRKEIATQVQMRFRYQLDAQWFEQLRPMQMLRDVCLKLGIQVQAKDYKFTADHGSDGSQPSALPDRSKSLSNGNANGDHSKKKKNKKARDGSPSSGTAPAMTYTFIPEDIVDVVPLVKHSCPRSALAEEALEAGRMSIMQNQKKLGQELLLESLSLHEQIYGILHPEVARVYNTLSMLYYQLDDKETAVELARKAVIVSERTVGIDSAETLLDYLNLSLFLHQVGDSKGALAYSKHALMLWKIIYGPDHPDSITTINNAAVMLQHLKAYHESRLWFEESLRICEVVFGKNSVNSATLLFQLAQALALDQDSKAAVNRMRESYNIFLSELGPEDKNTKEAESWLEQLTQNAVSIARHAKDVQARRLRSGIRFPAPTPATQAANLTSQHLPSTSQADSRSIDELIKFIEGGDQKSKASKKRPERGNPKRRSHASGA